jgi:hypothetical protein
VCALTSNRPPHSYFQVLHDGLVALGAVITDGAQHVHLGHIARGAAARDGAHRIRRWASYCWPCRADVWDGVAATGNAAPTHVPPLAGELMTRLPPRAVARSAMPFSPVPGVSREALPIPSSWISRNNVWPSQFIDKLGGMTRPPPIRAPGECVEVPLVPMDLSDLEPVTPHTARSGQEP